ncbi:MAG TPA: DUF3087 domain-containing protein [Oceanospirillaceae bacterium]|nr:DUF3087 domain-containing protein [Oceanospirillaceae bacterium]
MQLENIDKQRYSNHYRIIFWQVIAIMLGVSVTSSTLLIHFIGEPSQNNFWLNVAGVVIAAVVISSLFRRFKTHPFLYEVIYVWNLKQTLNKIYRKQAKITPAMEQGKINALIVMNFYYQGSKQLYQLDNNTITMEELNNKIQELAELLEKYQVNVSLEEFNIQRLEDFN